MKTFDQFYPDLLPQVPGCPEPVADQALKRAAQRFCELTFAWRAKLDELQTSPGTDEYDLPLDRNTELVRIESAKLDGQDIAVATQNDVSRHRPYVGCYDGKTLIVNPVPTAENTIVLLCSLKPGNGALGVEDFLYDRHCALIANGAAALLKRLPMKTYSSADGPMQWVDFESRCASIKLQLWRGNARNTPRAEPSWF
jgi:hypothetical protein